MIRVGGERDLARNKTDQEFMFKDFEKAPSRSSYQRKFVLAGLAVLALLTAWIARSGVGG